ncbi:kinase-like domain-containing protein [Mycena vulgaris]|nr:kinase-like domain-containing protein [Mycena vulgaris]
MSYNPHHSPDPEAEAVDMGDFNSDFTDFCLVHANAYGTVHRAVERTENRVVAVKTVTCPSNDPRFPNRYVSEDGSVSKDFTILETIDHPHVIEIISVYSGAGGPTSIILEYLAGGTLLEYLLDVDRQQQGCSNAASLGPGLPELACRDIMYQLCQAMAYVHRLGIVHCNLKPENILLTGQKIPFIKVGGFGLAMYMSRGERLTDIRGSFDYAAPEVICPSQPGYDHRADSWSAGITLFAMLILQSPHVSGHHVHGTAMNLQWDMLCERLSDEGRDLIGRLLCEDPRLRCSLEQALGHSWLFYHRPMYPNVVYPKVVYEIRDRQ